MARVAVLPGDGIGQEVAAEVLKLLVRLKADGLSIEFKTYDFSADRYLETGVAMPPGALEKLTSYDAIFIGAFGDPRVPDGAHACKIILGARQKLDLYVNLRPVRLLDERLTPLKGRSRADVDFVIVRENTEGAYVGAGGFVRKGTPQEVALQETVATRLGVERVLKYAFELARSRRRRRLVMADKHNALTFSSDLWFRTFTELSRVYADVEARHLFADNLCYQLVRDPSQFDVIVTDNLIGDLISDLGAGLAGGLGLAPSANLNPEKRPGLFEPVHGSAPDLAGKGVANPMAAFLSASMMLDFLGLPEAASRLESAVEACIHEGLTTPDLGGALTTSAVGKAVLNRL
jgi:3-isopropylmalate dehydrogenase